VELQMQDSYFMLTDRRPSGLWGEVRVQLSRPVGLGSEGMLRMRTIMTEGFTALMDEFDRSSVVRIKRSEIDAVPAGNQLTLRLRIRSNSNLPKETQRQLMTSLVGEPTANIVKMALDPATRSEWVAERQALVAAMLARRAGLDTTITQQRYELDVAQILSDPPTSEDIWGDVAWEEAEKHGDDQSVYLAHNGRLIEATKVEIGELHGLGLYL
jgi:hypothetical protein